MIAWIWKRTRSIDALSSSSILTSTASSSLMTYLKKFRCSNTVIASFMCSLYSYFFKYRSLERLFVIYNVSNFDYKPVIVSSSSCCTWPRLRDIIGSCLPLLDPTPLNPHLIYMHVLLAFPARSYEDLVALTISSLSFVVGRSFLYHWISWLWTWSQNFQSSTYHLIINLQLWYQLLWHDSYDTNYWDQ